MCCRFAILINYQLFERKVYKELPKILILSKVCEYYQVLGYCVSIIIIMLLKLMHTTINTTLYTAALSCFGKLKKVTLIKERPSTSCSEVESQSTQSELCCLCQKEGGNPLLCPIKNNDNQNNEYGL